MPLGGIGDGVSAAIDLCLGQRRAARPAPTWPTVAAFLRRAGNWRVLVDLVGVAMAGGLFTVPLYAVLQHESEPRASGARHRRQQHHQRLRDVGWRAVGAARCCSAAA